MALVEKPEWRGVREWAGELHGQEVSVFVAPMHERWCWTVVIGGVVRRSPEGEYGSADEATQAAFASCRGLLEGGV